VNHLLPHKTYVGHTGKQNPQWTHFSMISFEGGWCASKALAHSCFAVKSSIRCTHKRPGFSVFLGRADSSPLSLRAAHHPRFPKRRTPGILSGRWSTTREPSWPRICRATFEVPAHGLRLAFQTKPSDARRVHQRSPPELMRACRARHQFHRARHVCRQAADFGDGRACWIRKSPKLLARRPG